MGNFKQLKVWQDSEILVDKVYQATARFPSGEKYGLVSQMRRAATSISSNIGEGAGRKADKEFVRFLRIAVGSANELEGQLRSSRRAGYLEEVTWKELDRATQEVRQMLYGLIRFLRRTYDSRLTTHDSRLTTHRSFKISRAALYPHAPITPPPGWVAAPHMYRSFIGVR